MFLRSHDVVVMTASAVVVFAITAGVILGFFWPDSETPRPEEKKGSDEGEKGGNDGGILNNNYPEDDEVPFSVKFWQAFTIVRIVGFFLLTSRRVQKNKVLFTFIYVVLVVINNFEIYAIPNKTADVATLITVAIAGGIYTRYYAALTVIEKIITTAGVMSIFFSTTIIMNVKGLNEAFDIEPQLDISPYVSGIVAFMMLFDTIRTYLKVGSVKDSEESFLANQLTPVMKKKAEELEILKEEWAHLVDNTFETDSDWNEAKSEIIRLESRIQNLERWVQDSKRNLKKFNQRERNILNKYFKLDVTPSDLFNKSTEKRKGMKI